VAFLCNRYRVSRSGFYAWLNRKCSAHLRDDKALMASIKRVYEQFRGKRPVMALFLST